MLVLNSEQMRLADEAAIEGLGLSPATLMECAGVEVVRAMEEALGRLSGLRVLVLCGRGNNGGDGMVIARRLQGLDAFVQVLLLGDEESLSSDAKAQWSTLQRMGFNADTCDDAGWTQTLPRLGTEHWDVVVDAMLGTGTRGPLEGLFARVASDLNASDVPVVAVDLPTGLSSDTGRVESEAVEASLTVALAAPKLCHVFAPAMSHCGDVSIVDIGIPESCVSGGLELIEDELVADLIEDLVDRPEDSHKGTWGHVVVLGGQTASPGATALAGRAALTGGAGLVTVAAPAPCTMAIASQAAELMHLPLDADQDGGVGDALDRTDAILDRASCLLIGPGLGRGAGAAALLQALLERAEVPVILDADALNLAADAGALPSPRAERPLVLTPHPGELSRLATGLGLEEAAGTETMDERLAVAQRIADENGCVIVVKGFRSVIAMPDAVALVNPTGGPGLATAGSGDVLGGFLAALIAQGLAPPEAACAAVHLHGRAGDIAELDYGQMSLTASSLLETWPAAVESVFDLDEDEEER